MAGQRELWLLPLIPPLSAGLVYFAIQRRRIALSVLLLLPSAPSLWVVALVVAFWLGADAALAPLCFGLFSAVFSQAPVHVWVSKLPPEERSRPLTLSPRLGWKLRLPYPLTWLMGVSLGGAFFGPLLYQSQPPQTLTILIVVWLSLAGGTFLYERKAQRKDKSA